MITNQQIIDYLVPRGWEVGVITRTNKINFVTPPIYLTGKHDDAIYEMPNINNNINEI